MDSTDPRQGTMTGSCEHINGPQGSIKSVEFPDQQNKYQLLKKHDFVTVFLQH